MCPSTGQEPLHRESPPTPPCMPSPKVGNPWPSFCCRGEIFGPPPCMPMGRSEGRIFSKQSRKCGSSPHHAPGVWHDSYPHWSGVPAHGVGQGLPPTPCISYPIGGNPWPNLGYKGQMTRTPQCTPFLTRGWVAPALRPTRRLHIQGGVLGPYLWEPPTHPLHHTHLLGEGGQGGICPIPQYNP